MDAKTYLSRYHYLEIKIRKMREEIEEYERLANSIPGMSFDTIRVDGTKSLEAPFTKWIHKAMEKEFEIEHLEKTLHVLKCEIISVIDGLEDIDHRRVLIYRYLDWMTWDRIAEKMFVSYSTVRRMHSKVINIINTQENLILTSVLESVVK